MDFYFILVISVLFSCLVNVPYKQFSQAMVPMVRFAILIYVLIYKEGIFAQTLNLFIAHFSHSIGVFVRLLER